MRFIAAPPRPQVTGHHVRYNAFVIVTQTNAFSMKIFSHARVVERAVLAYALVFVVVLTLSPMEFSWPQIWAVAWWSDRDDLPANVLFFMPVGYLFVLARTPGRRHAVLSAALFGAALSATLETCQLFVPVRLTSLTDLLGNALGATLGAWLCAVVRARLRRALPEVLTIDHPLLNTVYLSLPLMGLASIDADPDALRTWLLLPLGLMGAITICGLWRYQLAARFDAPWPSVVLAVLLWFGSGASLSLLYAPGIVAFCALLVMLMSLALLAREPRWTSENGRFEAHVLARLWPCFALYLVMLVWWPPSLEFVPFHGGLWYPHLPFSRHMALRVVEQAAALTLFGYLVAETLGRRCATPGIVLTKCLVASGLCTLILEMGRGFLPNDQASFARGGLTALGAGFGVFLYRARINVVTILRGEPTAPGVRTSNTRSAALPSKG